MFSDAVVITGATSGIGLATAKLFTKTHTVIAIGRDLVKLQNLYSENDNVVTVCADLSSEASYKRIGRIANLGYNVTTFIHSAGIGWSQGFSSFDSVRLQEIFQVNVYSAFGLIAEFLPKMLSKGQGNICLVSSMAGLRGYKYSGAYCATKHALVGMAKSLASEHGKRGIISTVVCPGMVDTPMTDKTIAGLMRHQGISKEEAIAKLVSSNPQGRLLDPNEIAEAIVFACSSKSNSLNGSVLTLGGGE